MEALVDFLRHRRDRAVGFERAFGGRVYAGSLVLDGGAARRPVVDKKDGLKVKVRYVDGDQEDLLASDLWDGLRAQRGDIVFVNFSGAHMVGEVVSLAKEDKKGKKYNPKRSTEWLQIQVFNHAAATRRVLELSQKTHKGVLVRIMNHGFATLMRAFPSSREDAQRALNLPIWKNGALDVKRACEFNRQQAERQSLLVTHDFRTDVARALSRVCAPLQRLAAVETGEALQRRLSLVRETAWTEFARLDLRGGGGEGGSDSDDFTGGT